MQTLITEGARSSCEHRLPAGSRADHAQLVTLYTDEQFFSTPPFGDPSEGGDRKECVQSLSRSAAPQQAEWGLD
jgi:hypothetical protein